jgi:RimJ/RimL family protein N-acetyltransferase
MHLRSLGYRTDLMFPRFDGLVVDRGEYLVVRTPSNPRFWWGNFLLFAAPPGPEDLPRWRELFAAEIGEPPQIDHLAFGWDAPDGATGALQPFLDAGFALIRNVVRTATTTAVHPPPRPHDALVMRPVSSALDWQEALELQLRCQDDTDLTEAFVAFTHRQMVRYRMMAEAGRGAWFGAFLDDVMVGGLGVFTEDGLGCFQEVVTNPAYRRQGICGTLVAHASQYAFAQLGAQTLVIVTDSADAGRIYESVGYRVVEQQVGVDWVSDAH